MLLAGDIGGTNIRMAVISEQAGPRAPLAEGLFPSNDYPDLESAVAEFLDRLDLKVERACFGVAGPVVDQRASLTNLPWEVDARSLRNKLNLSAVYLLNDLEAIANAVSHLEPADLCTLNPGEPVAGGARAVIAPGTGLGEAYLTWDGADYRAHASEGGHTDFGPTNALEMDLLRYMLERHEHVSYERVCSGMGLPNLYAFLKDRGHAPELPDVAARLAEAADPTPAIVEGALEHDPPSPRCAAALDLFVSILGAEAGNLALKTLATAGVYVGGGIPPRILPALQRETFMKAFLRKGRFSRLMSSIPVHVILYPHSALLGAACFGLQMKK